jgi:hypothetical protein
MKRFQKMTTGVLYALLCGVKKALTHNYCDGCGFTKEEVYTTEIFSEGGYNECKRCYEERVVV